MNEDAEEDPGSASGSGDARYVKLVVEKPTQGSDTAARIYEVEVYGLNEAL